MKKPHIIKAPCKCCNCGTDFYVYYETNFPTVFTPDSFVLRMCDLCNEEKQSGLINYLRELVKANKEEIRKELIIKLNDEKTNPNNPTQS